MDPTNHHPTITCHVACLVWTTYRTCFSNSNLKLPRGMFGVDHIPDIIWCGPHTGHILVWNAYRTYLGVDHIPDIVGVDHIPDIVGVEHIPDIFWCGPYTGHYLPWHGWCGTQPGHFLVSTMSGISTGFSKHLFIFPHSK